MAYRTIKRFIVGTTVLIGVGSALTVLFLLSRTAQNTQDYDKWHEYEWRPGAKE